MQRESIDVRDIRFDVAVLGSGEPTVVFVNGLGSPLEEWAPVAPRIAEQCRVVCYDRRPAPPAGPVPVHDTASMVADLHLLLATLGVDGPLVLVGHSWGGAVIRRYAADHPADVAGLVFVDASHERIKGMIPNAATKVMYTGSTLVLRIGPVRRRLIRSLGFGKLTATQLATVESLTWLAQGRTSLAEYAGIGSSLRDLQATAPDLPPVPTQVLLAGGRPGLMTKLGGRQMAGIRAVWEQAVADRPDITLRVVPGSGHYISLDQPQAVIDAITDVATRISRR